jgi:hypothetical protein
MDQPPIFSALLGLAVIFMVEILPAAGVIAPDNLQLAFGRWVDRNLNPRRRHSKLLYSSDIGGRDSGPIGTLVRKSSLRSANSDDSSLL